MIIKNGTVFTKEGVFKKLSIRCTADRISDLGPKLKATNKEAEFDAHGLLVIPGLIETHFHGCAGEDFNEIKGPASLKKMAQYLAANGITAMLPTSLTLSTEKLKSIYAQATAYQATPHPGTMLIGIHMEGPYLNPAKKGAQNGQYLRSPDLKEFEQLQQLTGGMIRLLSLAPELAGGLEFIQTLKNKVGISLAHTAADYDLASLALAAGANRITHLYNAMPPFLHRAPGVIGAAYDHQRCWVELITDGIHLHPSVIRATFTLFGQERIVLVSDSMMATGLGDGNFYLGELPVKVVGRRATLTDGNIASSVSNLMDCLRCCVDFGIPLTQAIQAATINPAQSIGVDQEMGSIETGKLANLVVLNPDNLAVVKVWIKGKSFG